MTAITPPLQLSQLFTDAEATLTQLKDCLMVMRASLIEDDATALNNAVKKEKQLMGELNRWGEVLNELLVHEGIEPGPSGLSNLLSSSDEFNKLSPQWQRIQASLVACQNQNKANHKLVNQRQRSALSALNILLGRHCFNYDSYDRQGRSPELRSYDSMIARV